MDCAILILLAIVLRAPTLMYTVIDPDEHAFALAARELVSGFLPYTTFFDIKPPGSTLMIGAAFAVLGPKLWVLRLVGIACVAASAVLLRTLAAKAGWSRPLAFATGALYVGFSFTLHGLATMTELMLAPFSIASVAMLVWMAQEAVPSARLRLALGAGLACGAAVSIKLVPLGPCGLALGVVLLQMLATRRAHLLHLTMLGMVFVVGAVLPMALLALVYLVADQSEAFIYANFGFAGAYQSQGRGLEQALRELIKVATELWPLLVLTLVGLLRALQDLVAKREPTALTFVAGAWLIGEFIASCLTGHFYGHYFLMMLPPLCLLAVEGVRALHGWLGVADVKASAALAIAAALVPAAPVFIRAVPANVANPLVGGPDVFHETANVITKASGARKPTLWATSQELMVLYLLTGAEIPTRYAVPAHLFGAQSSLSTNPGSEIQRILQSRPEFIVRSNEAPLDPLAETLIQPVLAADYVLYRQTEDFYVFDVGVTRRYSYDIYRRQPSAVAPTGVPSRQSDSVTARD